MNRTESIVENSTFVTDDGLAGEVIGPRSGVPLVWAHGMTSSRRAADSMLLFDWSTLADVRLVRYDARGHGESRAETSPETCSWDSLARDFLAVMDRVGLERAAMGGASMGSVTAIGAAMLAPQRAEQLILAIPPAAWETRPLQCAAYRRDADNVEQHGLGPYIAAMRSAPTPAALEVLGPKLRADAIERIQRVRPSTLVDVLRGASRSDLPSPSQLSTITAPTLVLAWADDPGHPLSTAATIADSVPQVSVHVATKHADLAGWATLVGDFLRSPQR